MFYISSSGGWIPVDRQVVDQHYTFRHREDYFISKWLLASLILYANILKAVVLR